MVILGGYVCFKKVFFSIDTAGGHVITFLFVVYPTGTCFLMTTRYCVLLLYRLGGRLGKLLFTGVNSQYVEKGAKGDHSVYYMSCITSKS